MVERWWHGLEDRFPHISADWHIVMPNHFHGILVIRETLESAGVHRVGADPRVCPSCGVVHRDTGAHTGAPLPRIVQWFKTMTTNEYIRRVESDGWRRFSGRLWQRNYYEHIIRGEADLLRAREYISLNPAKWGEDEENPGKGPRQALVATYN